MIKRLASTLLMAAFLSAPVSVCAGDKQAVSDDLIYDNVKRKLATDYVVKGGALDIDVKSGIVTLKGTVASDKQKSKAEKLARKVGGVKSVVNELTIKPLP